MSKPLSSLDAALQEQLYRREARSELFSCLIFGGAALTLFILIALLGATREFHSLEGFRATFLSYLALVAILVVVVKTGRWHPILRFVNTAAQITMLTMFLYIGTKEKGPTFALTTALPMLYCLAISITAFRLSPWLSFFAGVLAAVEIVALYAWFMAPKLTPQMVEINPALGWPAMLARVIVLFAIGIACAVAANTLRRQIKKQTADQGRIHLLERTFGRLVAPEVARQILEDENWMKPSRRDAVIMFADLQGFTKYSEGKSPEEVADFLNRCWSVAADIVEKHGGVINKYLGDGFLAIFGVPLELVAAEKSAAATAAELDEALSPILHPENLNLCIGLHAGPMIVGGIGSESRCEFTVIGSTVNLASRIEALNRPLETRCLTSEPVAAKIAGDWDLEHRGGHRVKGVADEVNVFELRAKKPSP